MSSLLCLSTATWPPSAPSPPLPSRSPRDNPCPLHALGPSLPQHYTPAAVCSAHPFTWRSTRLWDSFARPPEGHLLVHSLPLLPGFSHPFCPHHSGLQEDPAQDGQVLRSAGEPKLHQGSNQETDPCSDCYLYGLLHFLGTFPQPATCPAHHVLLHPAFLLHLQHSYQPGLCQ